ncbi:putative holliday junction resolvase [Candidatus Vecturithrix granuli]|uniref:Putative pre-16S rRNA nuclease n=1 Tax=Vecturithrix granuli TaxID=1499967 RepID=A0A081BV41_VECG1|nr:putative holliday junction resolvase [Candidatus Vecturithrix granuli]
MIKALGLDVGGAKIGVAVSDGLGYTAQGMTTFTRRSLQHDLKTIRQLIHENDIGEVVIGLPLHLNGHYSAQTKKVMSFCRYLSQNLHVPVRTWDERLTTVQAINILKTGHVRWKKRAPLVDKVAAIIILQGYLDWKNIMQDTNVAVSG